MYEEAQAFIYEDGKLVKVDLMLEQGQIVGIDYIWFEDDLVNSLVDDCYTYMVNRKPYDDGDTDPEELIKVMNRNWKKTLAEKVAQG